MLYLDNNIVIAKEEIILTPIRAQGAGGQNVNKVSSAIHLRFDVRNSSLPEELKQRILRCKDSRLTKEGVIIIKSQRYRTQELNRRDALNRLQQFILSVSQPQKPRIKTKPSQAAKRKRIENKKKRAQTKVLRKKLSLD